MKKLFMLIILLPLCSLAQTRDPAGGIISENNYLLIDKDYLPEVLALNVPREFTRLTRVEVLDDSERMLFLSYLDDFGMLEQDIINLPEGEYHLNVYLPEGRLSANIRIVTPLKTAVR
jgi:hypothetical protein